jgi:hypothetical protein
MSPSSFEEPWNEKLLKKDDFLDDFCLPEKLDTEEGDMGNEVFVATSIIGILGTTCAVGISMVSFTVDVPRETLEGGEFVSCFSATSSFRNDLDLNGTDSNFPTLLDRIERAWSPSSEGA